MPQHSSTPPPHHTPHIPHTRPGLWPLSIAPGRLAADVRTGDPAGARVAILGIPDDLGVRLNNGRPGAAGGPAAFRAALARYGVADPAGWSWPLVFDAGDVVPAEGADAAALLETHRRVADAARALIDAGLLVVGVGGGHDLTLPLVRAAIDAGAARSEPVSRGVYFDAHLDVRPQTGSGMPFRRLIEDHGVTDLRVVGLDPFANSREHVTWFKAHGGRILDPATPGWTSALAPDAPCFVSVDMDVFAAADAPGVSALNPAGLAPGEVLPAVRALAATGTVRAFDIMELNPAFDHDGRTARLAARVFLEFLRGLAEHASGVRP